MKKLLFVFILGIAASVHAQTKVSGRFVDVEISDKIKLPAKHYYNSIFLNPSINLMYTGKKTFAVSSLDGRNELDSIYFIPKPKSKEFRLEQSFNWKGKSFVLGSDYTSKNRTESLILWSVNSSKDAFIFDEKVILSHPGKLKGDVHNLGYFRYAVTNKYKFGYSDQAKYFVVLYQPLDMAKGDMTQDVLTFFDEDFKKQFQVSLAAKGEWLASYELGDEFIYIKAEKEDMGITFKKNVKPKTFLHIHKINLKTHKTKSLFLDLDKIGINGILFEEGPNNSILAMGYYFDANSKGILGYFTTKIDIDAFKMGDIKYVPFNKELIVRNETAKEVKRSDKVEAKGQDVTVKELLASKIFKRSDGGFYLFGEQFYEYVVTNIGSKGEISYTYHIVHGDEYITSLDENLNELWVRKIPKHQDWTYSADFGGLSSFMENDNMYIFRLDNGENRNLVDGAPKVLRGSVGSFLSVSKIDVNGKVDTEFLLSEAELAEMILPKDMVRGQNGEIIAVGKNYITSKNKRKNSIYKFKLK